MIRRFDSISALRQKAIDLDCMRAYAASDSWVGETMAETLKWSEIGNRALVPEAEKLLSQLDTQIETPRRSWEPAPAGAFCVVPDVLAGLPTYMRRLRDNPSEHAPITILAISTSSGGIDAKILMKRGTAILALVMVLSQSRPISLHSVSILDGHIDESGESVLCTRIETAPLDLSMATYALTSAGFARRMNYSISYKLDKSGGCWPTNFRYGHPTGGGYYDYLAATLSPDPNQTLVIGAAQLNDQLITAPVAWINDQVRRFTQDQEDQGYV